MEDILASIKRIIAEDSESVGARSPKARREAMAAVAASPALRPVETDVLDPAPEPAAERTEAESAAPAVATHEPETAPETREHTPATAGADETDLPDILELTSPMPEADTAPATKHAPADSDASTPEGLLSSPAAEASRNAFAALGQMQVRTEDGASNTLDGLVADLLRPMLREWLDRELPAMVERLVSAEVARLSGRN